MEWNLEYSADNQPSQVQIANFIQSSLWGTLNDYLCQAYRTEPKYAYSSCSMQPGWNVKYSKSGKSLCTLYPMNGYFIALVVIGRKEMLEAELLMPCLSKYVQNVFKETIAGQGAKWLMLEVQSSDTMFDIIELISLRVKPSITIKMGV